VAFAADLAAILDPALPVTPAFRDLPRIPEEIR
jgi:histidinol-phosphate aminotransferase